MDNQAHVQQVIEKYTKRYNQCKTDKEREKFISSLTPDEKREMGNAATYIKLQALVQYSNLPEEKRKELQKGNLSVLSR